VAVEVDGAGTGPTEGTPPGVEQRFREASRDVGRLIVDPLEDERRRLATIRIGGDDHERRLGGTPPRRTAEADRETAREDDSRREGEGEGNRGRNSETGNEGTEQRGRDDRSGQNDREGESERRGGRERDSNDLSKIYVVKAGDTLSEISQRELGTSKVWKLILLANSDKISRAEDIRPGMKLELPAVVIPPEERPRRPDGSYDPTPDDGDVRAGRFYVVKPGDSFRKIARLEYNDEAMWKALWDVNRGRLGLEAPNKLRVGQKVKVPRLVRVERTEETTTETVRLD
jgi:nucleoid-associated protein YgaU